MDIAYIVVIAVVALVIIAALFVFIPRGGRSYARMADKHLRSQNKDMGSDFVEEPERPRPVRMKTSGGDNSLTATIISTLRIVIGLTAVGVLAYVGKSTFDTAGAAADAAAKTSLYTEGIFKAVITIGIAAAVYILTKYSKQ